MDPLNRRNFLSMVGGGAAALGLGASNRPIAAQNPATGITRQNRDFGDEYWEEPRSTFEQRRQQYLEFCSRNARRGRNGLFSQIARLELGEEPLDAEILDDAFEFVRSDRDCNDFAMAGFLRILHRYCDNPAVSEWLLTEIERSVLDFKYWWDEPGGDGRCYHTENHQIIFHMDQLLAGQLFPDSIFTNSGMTGAEQIDLALPRIRRWIDFRVRFGFSEWLSNCYFDHNLMALANLRDFARDDEIRTKSEMLMDVLLFEIALHSHRGVFGSTHGRTNAYMIKGGREEHTACLGKLMFGMGVFNQPDSLGCISLATSDYRLPAVLERIALEPDLPMLCRERHSLDISEAPEHGLSYDKEEDGVLYWSIQDYVHPAILDLSQRMSETYGVRQFEDYGSYADRYARQIQDHGRIVNPNLCNKALTAVRIQTYRTENYMLSCAQDFRPGIPGYQQHIWQATIDPDAVVFTNHPGSDNETYRPNFWAGNGILPRAAQHKNVVVCIHRIPEEDEFPYSHAYFPKAAFDEVRREEHWTFGRRAGAYLALFSSRPIRWVSGDAIAPEVELRADSPWNIWICEMGAESDWGGFEDFVRTIGASRVGVDGLAVEYDSPSLKTISFGWEGPLRVGGKEVSLRDYPRFDNPYCKSEFTSERLEIRHGIDRLHLDFAASRRTVS